MPDGRPFDLLLRQLLDQVNAAAAVPPAPIKLTKAQLGQLRAKLPAGVASDPAAAYFGTPIVFVDSTVESTPYLDGWIKCPSCGKPAAGHDELPCDLVLIFGPFGDFAVSGAPAAGLRRLRHQLEVAAARKQAAHAIARWEDDGGHA